MQRRAPALKFPIFSVSIIFSECFTWYIVTLSQRHSKHAPRQKPERADMNAMTHQSLEGRIPAMPPVHDVYSLTRGGALAQILLDGKTYQLRITRAGKLILTK